MRVWMVLWVLLWPTLGWTQTLEGARRYALVIGSNQGDAQTSPLRWAQEDSLRMKRLLTEVGGVSPERVFRLTEPSREMLLKQLRVLREKLAREDASKVEFIFYYSGHANERGLMLGKEGWGYDELREAMEGLPARFGLVIVDACASGSLVRGKGGRRVASLPIGGEAVRGRVYLTAAAAHEQAQESDRLRGAIFTHYLLSGMRGAADVSGDRKVTLQELYHFTFQETLRKTQKTRIGAQHPGFDITMVGQGELVVTAFEKQSARLVFPSKLKGHFALWDGRGRIVAEFYKAVGATSVLAVTPRLHEVYMRDGEHVRVARVHPVAGKDKVLVASLFSETKGQVEMARGRGESQVLPMPDKELAELARVLEDVRVSRAVQRVKGGWLCVAVGGLLVGSMGLSLWSSLSQGQDVHLNSFLAMGVGAGVMGLGAYQLSYKEPAEIHAERYLASHDLMRAEGMTFLQELAAQEPVERWWLGGSLVFSGAISSAVGAFVLLNDPWTDSSTYGVLGLTMGLGMVGVGTHTLLTHWVANHGFYELERSSSRAQEPRVLLLPTDGGIRAGVSWQF